MPRNKSHRRLRALALHVEKIDADWQSLRPMKLVQTADDAPPVETPVFLAFGGCSQCRSESKDEDYWELLFSSPDIRPIGSKELERKGCRTGLLIEYRQEDEVQNLVAEP